MDIMREDAHKLALEGDKPNGGQFAIDSPAAPLGGAELA